ncbi:hypothetical protein MRX96_038664 [Rhipicephalus microplus]
MPDSKSRRHACARSSGKKNDDASEERINGRRRSKRSVCYAASVSGSLKNPMKKSVGGQATEQTNRPSWPERGVPIASTQNAVQSIHFANDAVWLVWRQTAGYVKRASRSLSRSLFQQSRCELLLGPESTGLCRSCRP